MWRNSQSCCKKLGYIGYISIDDITSKTCFLGRSSNDPGKSTKNRVLKDTELDIERHASKKEVQAVDRWLAIKQETPNEKDKGAEINISCLETKLCHMFYALYCGKDGADRGPVATPARTNVLPPPPSSFGTCGADKDVTSYD